jgi:hypothetical protein
LKVARGETSFDEMYRAIPSTDEVEHDDVPSPGTPVHIP